MDLNYAEAYPCELDYPKFDYESSLKAHCDLFADNALFSPSSAEDLVNEYKSAEDKRKTKLYFRQKEKFDRIISHSKVDRLIQKEYWTDFGEIIGSTGKVFCHPHMLFAQEKMIEIMTKKKRSDVLVATVCSLAKPYSSVMRLQRFINCSRDTGMYDFLVYSIIPIFITPVDFSVCYPFSAYSMEYHNTSDLMGDLGFRMGVKHLVETITRLGYKKVIFVHGGALDDKIKYLREWGFTDKTLVDVFHIDLYHRASQFEFSSGELPEPKQFYPGLVKSRFITGNAISCFMRDVFGPQAFPYFKTGWEHVEDNIKEYAGYSEAKVKEIVDGLGITAVHKPVEFVW